MSARFLVPRRPKAPLCKGSCRGYAAIEGLPEVAGHFGDDLCRMSHPPLVTAGANALLRWPGWPMGLSLLPVGAEAMPSVHRPAAAHHDRPVGAGLCPRPLLPGLMGPPVKPWGPTHVSARTHFLPGPVHGRTHRSAPTRLPEAFRNQWESMQKTAPASAERREKRRLCRVLIRQ